METATPLPTRPVYHLNGLMHTNRTLQISWKTRLQYNNELNSWRSHHWYSNFSHESDFSSIIQALAIIWRLAGKINVFSIRRCVWNAEELRIRFLLFLVGRKRNVDRRGPTLLHLGAQDEQWILLRSLVLNYRKVKAKLNNEEFHTGVDTDLYKWRIKTN